MHLYFICCEVKQIQILKIIVNIKVSKSRRKCFRLTFKLNVIWYKQQRMCFHGSHLNDEVVVPYNLCVFLVLAFAVPPLAKHDRCIHVCRRKGVGFIQQWDHAQQDCSTDKHTRYSTVQKIGVFKIFEMFLKRFLVLTKSAFIWYKI